MPGENPTTRFKVDISELKAGITESNRLIRLANSEFKAASSGMENWADSSDGLEAKLKQLNTVYDAENAKLKSLKDQYALVAAEQGENSKGAQELAIKINNQQAAVNKVASELNTYGDRLEEVKTAQQNAERSGRSLEDELKDIRSAAEDAGEAAEDSGDGYTILKDVIADLASKAISSAIEGFKNLALEGEAALDILQAKVGATNDEMAGYGDVAKNIYKNAWGESLDEVTEALGTVINMTDNLNDEDLQKVTENAMSLSDVYGWDVKESMRAVNSLMNQFGLESDEAFNLLTQGAQNGLDQNDDLLDTINEYSVQFKNAGFSADDMFNMLNNGAKSGTWSIDKLGDAVKEYNIRWTDGTAADALNTLGFNADDMAQKMNEGGEGSAKAMQAVIMALSGVEDEQERYLLGQQLMGTMWEDLGEDAVLSLMNTNGEISKSKDAMGQLKTDAYDNLATSVTTLGRSLKDEILTPIVEAIAPKVTSFLNWVIDNLPIIAPIITGLAVALGVLATALGIASIISGVQKAMALLNATMLLNPFVLIAALIAGLVAAFIYLWNTSEGFRNFFINLWESIKTTSSDAIEAVVGFFSELPGRIGEWLSNAKTKVTDWGSDLWAKSKETGLNFLNAIVSFFSTLPSKIWSFLAQTIARVITWKNNLIAKGKEAAKGLFDAVVNKIAEIPGKMLSIGGDIVKGLWNGINNMTDWVIGKIQGFTGNVLGGIKDFFGIESPSKVMRDVVGKNLVKGIAVGVDDESGSLNSSIKSSLSGAIGAAKSSLQTSIGGSSAGATGGSSVVYNFNQTNNSPKALSRLELYRQTRNQFRQLSEV